MQMVTDTPLSSSLMAITETVTTTTITSVKTSDRRVRVIVRIGITNSERARTEFSALLDNATARKSRAKSTDYIAIRDSARTIYHDLKHETTRR